MKTIILFIALCLGACSTSPLQPPQHRPNHPFSTFAGFTLGESTLADVQRRYGISPIKQSGDAGDFHAWLCYSTPGAEVRFHSGELGGGSVLLGFTLSKQRTEPRCPMPKRSIPLRLNETHGPIRLGMSRNDYALAVEHPLQWSKNTATWQIESSSITNDGIALDVLTIVTATFDDEGLSELSVWHTENN